MATQDVAPLLQWDTDSPVNSIAVSHDGMRVASGSNDHVVLIWDVHTGDTVLGPLEGHVDEVLSVAWSYDDTRLVSGSIDATIRIWDTGTGASVGEPLQGHTDRVWSVAFSPDSTCIVSGSEDHTIRIWDAYTGAPIGEPLRGHTGSVYSVVFSPNRTLFASGWYGGPIRIWNARMSTPAGEPLRGHTSSVESVAFSHDSTRVVSGSRDQTIRIWDARTGAPIGEPLWGHTHFVKSVAFSHDSIHIVSGSYDMTIRIWNAHTGATVGEPLRGHTDWVNSVAFSPDDTRIVSGSRDRTIRLWEAPQSTPLFDMVTSNMSADEMFQCLVRHGCTDFSSSLDANHDSLLPITNGGFGDVWRVTVSSGSVFAVKTLRLQNLLRGDTKGAKRAAREVHHWSRLHHPNVQELLGIVVFRGGLGMVSPWLANGNLPSYLAEHPEAQRYPLCIQLAEGVLYLHSVNMNNVLVSDNGILKINDFDYAVLSDSSLRFSTTTRPGGGTMRWMAPELYEAEDEKVQGEPQVTRNKQTDVYALGMTMLEIFTGEVPFAEYRTDAGVCTAILKKQIPRRPSQLSGSDKTTKQVWKLLGKCWSRDPGARPDAATVLQLLKSHQGGAHEIDGSSSSTPGTLTPVSSSASTSTLRRIRSAYKSIVR